MLRALLNPRPLEMLMEDCADLEISVSAMAAAGTAEVREDGEWIGELASLRCEFKIQAKSAVVHLWSDQRNLTRQIVGVAERTSDRIVLRVQRFGRAKPGKLEFFRTGTPRSAARINREDFRMRIRRFLAERFPDASFAAMSCAPDLEHSFSGLYVRGRMHEFGKIWAFLAASPGENALAIDGLLTFSILWLDWTRSHSERAPVEGLRLFVPEGVSRVLRERALALSTAARSEIFEFDEAEGRVQRMDLADAGNLDSRLIPRSTLEWTLQSARNSFERILDLARKENVAGDASAVIAPRVSPAVPGVAFCFRGLEFAHFSVAGVSFGVGASRQKLTASSQHAAAKLLHRLELQRNPLASETKSYLYRAAPERWLESLIFQDPTRLDAQLDSRFFYSQVPALAAGDRGILDLLGVTRRGRLVIIELKASEDIQMPLQAVDYWLRVCRHQRAGDLQRNGYFPGIELSDQPPLVWLVAPGLRFHPATDILLKYLSPEIGITRIGLAENWRRGIKVIFRQ